MILIEPTTKINFKEATISNNKNSSSIKPDSTPKNKTSLIVGSLTALAATGAAIVALVKTKPTTFEEVLKKAEVEIKNNVAKKIGSDENFTGKIERFDTRTSKETVEYVDGIITEKVYHSVTGKEIRGTFYKNGMPKLGVGNITKRGKNVYYAEYEFENGHIITRGDAVGNAKNSVFEECRNIVNNL